MKFYGPDKSLLIDVQAIKPHPEGIVIEGKIMGAMPMKAVLRPAEMRSAFQFLTWALIRRVFRMLIAKGPMATKPKGAK